MNLRILAGLAALLALCCSAIAEAPPSKAPGAPTSVTLQPVSVYDAAGNIVSAFGGGSGGGGASTVTGSQEQDVRASNTLNATTANAAVTLPINGQATVGFTFTGLAASGATVTFEQSNDGGTTWTGVNEVNAGTGVPSATRSTDGQTRVAVQGRTNLRVRISTVGTGTITVASNISVREGLVTLASPLPPGANTIGNFNLVGPIPAGTNSIGSVLADLRVGGAAVGTGNPVPAQITSGTVTANLGTLNGAALDSTVAAGTPKSYTLAANAAAAGAGTATGAIKGADYVWSLEGNLAGLTGILQVLGLDGVTWANIQRADGTSVQCSAACATAVSVGQGRSVRVNLTGTASGTPAVYSALSGLN